jgi:hypothetical protein
VEDADAREWWDALWSSAPPRLRGLWFGLVELLDGGWHLYVAGTERFDSTDETADWAAYPYAWRPDGGYLPFPDAEVLAASDAVAEAVALVRALAPWQDLSVDGVAAGFDDGDFEIVYAR